MDKRNKNAILFLLVILLSIILPAGALAVKSTAELVAAIDAAQNGDTITLENSFELGQKITISKDLIIDGNGHTITRADDYLGMWFNVAAAGKLTLLNITLDAGNEWTLDQEKYDFYLDNPAKFANETPESVTYNTTAANYPYVYPLASEKGAADKGATDNMINVSGQLILKKSTIQNFYSVEMKNHDHNVDGVDVPYYSEISGKAVINANAGSTILMEDATIRHCAGGGSGTVLRAGGKYTCTIKGNTLITDNFGGSNGGILHGYSGSTVIMESGKITGNRGANANGTVIALHQSGATFEMKGGEITNNSGIIGVNNGFNSAIYCHSGSTFKMSGGVISGNKGRCGGGVFFRVNASKLEISGGSIVDNYSYLDRYDDDLFREGSDDSRLTISGGTFGGYVGDWIADGYVDVQLAEDLWKVCKLGDIYTINYVLNGGNLPENVWYPTMFIEGMSYELPNPERDNIVFLGWTSDTIKKPALNLSVINAPAGDVTYYANWEIIDLPTTGDESSLIFWVAMLFMVGSALLMIRKRAGEMK